MQPCMAKSSCATISSSPPPCRAALALTTPVSNSYKREPKLHQSAASVGSAIPPTSAEEQERGQSWSREQQWLCPARHISLSAEAPSALSGSTGPRVGEGRGDASLTWGTVQLLPCLAAALGLHLCPLAKEGETDVTCRAAQSQKQGGEDKGRDFEQSTKQSHIAISPQLGTARALGLCHALNTEALRIPRQRASPASQCLPQMPSRPAQLVGSKLVDLRAGCSEERSSTPGRKLVFPLQSSLHFSFPKQFVPLQLAPAVAS